MAKKKMVRKPRLRICAADWTLTGYPTVSRPWSNDMKVRRAKEAGFVGYSCGAHPSLIKALK